MFLKSIFPIFFFVVYEYLNNRRLTYNIIIAVLFPLTKNSVLHIIMFNFFIKSKFKCHVYNKSPLIAILTKASI